MNAKNQNQNSTSTDFDKELNDIILRRKQLQQAIISFADDIDPLSQTFVDSLSAELKLLNKKMKEKVRG